jgi:hypothetical protein
MNRLFNRSLIFFLVIIFIFYSCKKTNNNQPTTEKNIIDNFTSDANNWIGDFADYPNEAGMLPLYKLEFAHSSLPAPLNTSDGAVKQSGANLSDDLFMFIKKKVGALEPGKNYSVEIKIDFATNAGSNMIGIGGAPGEGVTIKAGAVPYEPVKVLNTPENWYRMNIDKGNQSNSGVDMKVIGNFANGTNQNSYSIKQLSTTTPLSVKANQQGEIWLVIGTDSGFEGTTTIFYNTIQVLIK